MSGTTECGFLSVGNKHLYPLKDVPGPHDLTHIYEHVQGSISKYIVKRRTAIIPLLIIFKTSMQ